MIYDFDLEHRYALVRAGLIAGFAFWAGLFAQAPLSAQDPNYQVIVGGQSPTTIHSYPESLALEPLLVRQTNDRNSVRPYAVDVSPDGEFVAVVTEDNHQFLLLNRETLGIQRRFTMTGAGMDVLFHPDGSAVYALTEAPWGKPSHLFIYYLAESRWQFVELPRMSQPGELIMSPDHSTLMIRNYSNLHFINLGDFSITGRVTLPATSRDWVFSQDGRFMYVSAFGSLTSPGASVVKIDLATQSMVAEIPVRKNPGALSLSPDGRWLAVATFDLYPTRKVGLIEFIDTETDEVLRRPYQGTAFIEDLMWLPGNQMMVFLGDSFGYLGLQLSVSPDETRWVVVENEMVSGNASRTLFQQALFNPADNMVYVRFQDAVFGLDRHKTSEVLRFPIDKRTTDMALSPDGQHLLVTTMSTSRDEENQVLALPTKKFSQVKRYEYPYQLNGAAIDHSEQTMVFVDSNKRFWSVEADALCQVSEVPLTGSHSVIHKTADGNLLVGFDLARVSFFDRFTGQKLRDISVGRSPRGMFVTPNEHFVLVPNNYSNTVSLIDVASQNLVRHIPVGTAPVDLATNDDFAYVLNYSSNSLSVVDIGSASVVSTIPFSYRPSQIEMTLDGQTLLVLHANDRRVSVIDVATEQIRQELSVPSRVTLFKVNPAGDRLLLGVSSPREVYLYGADSPGGEWSTIKKHTLDLSPSSVHFTPNGERIYVGIDFGRYGDGEYQVFDGRTFETVAKFPTVGSLKFIHFTEATAASSDVLSIPDPVLKAHLVSLYDQDCDDELSLDEIEHVTAVEFPADPETADRVVSLAGLEAFPHLARIVVTNHQVSDIGTLPPTLAELNLYGNQILEVGGLPEGLRILNLSRNPLVNLNGLPSTLVAALLDHTELSSLPQLPAALRVLALNGTPSVSLNGLDLSRLWWLGLSDWDLAEAPEGLHLPDLRYMDLVNNRCSLIPSVSAMPNLIFLDLTQNPLGDGVCDQLADLAVSHPNLDVSIGNLTGETPACAAKRGKQRPTISQLLNQIRTNGGVR